VSDSDWARMGHGPQIVTYLFGALLFVTDVIRSNACIVGLKT